MSDWAGTGVKCQYAACPREDAIEVKLPDRTSGWYCDEHGDTVASRVARRMKLKASSRDTMQGQGNTDQPGGDQ